MNFDKIKAYLATPALRIPVSRIPDQQSASPASPSGPKYLGCYSSGPKAYNGNRVATNVDFGITDVTGCNTAAKATGKNYFGMSYWQGAGYDSTGKKYWKSKLCMV